MLKKIMKMRREINRRRYNSKEISERKYDEKYEMRNEKKVPQERLSLAENLKEY